MKSKLIKKVMILVVISVISVLMCISVSAQGNENATRIYSLQRLFSAVRVELPTDIIVIDEVLSEYDDVQNLNFEEKQALAFAIQNGYITGYPDGSIRPYDNITRGEYAVILNRCDSILKNNQIVINHPELYDDVEYWCRDAVSYCMERCYMVGYGDSFGTNDNLTVEQVNIIAGRSYYGMSDIEKYNMTVLLRSNGLKYPELMNTRYDANLRMSSSYIPERANPSVVLFPDYGETDSNKYKMKADDCENILTMIGEYVDLTGNIDYNFYQDEDSRLLLAAQIIRVIEGKTRTVDEIVKYLLTINYKGGYVYSDINDKIENKVKMKSVFVSAPENTMEYGRPLSGTTTYIRGYEYFIYYEGMSEALPEGVELGKWYRREVVFSHEKPASASASLYNIDEDYSDSEPVPEYLLEEIN